MGENDDSKKKGRVCVTGGTGYLGSWLVMRLLQHGYYVHTTIRRLHSDSKRDISYLTNLPGASERLIIFDADLDQPESFAPAISGCAGVFHVAHPLDFEEKDTEEVSTQRSISALLRILQACVDSKTVRRVVYTSTVGTATFNATTGSSEAAVDESSWTDVEFVRSLGAFGGIYMLTKTLTERVALEYAESHGLDLVAVLPSWIHGPFLCPRCPDSVYICNALILGDKKYYHNLTRTSLVHVDDVVRAHIHLFEYPKAKGRYICSSADITIDTLHHFLSHKYPQLELPSPDSWKDFQPIKFPGLSTEKLLKTGFNYENGLQEMYDGAIKSCKEIGLL